jgi:ParB-like chromosome segregation protein Spo0J
MEIRDLPLDELVLDPTLNLRDRLDQDTVDRYVDSWQRMPPVTVFEVEGRWLLADGVHRHAAAVTLNRKSIKAEVREGTFEHALDYVTVANLHHGLPLTRAERRRAVEVRLRLHHDRSDRHLAEEMGIGRELIAKVRRQLVEGGQIPEGGTRLGADGKVYPALPRDPNERQPRTAAEAGADPEARSNGRGKPEAPWDDTSDPLPPLSQGNPIGPSRGPRNLVPPWEDEAPDARAVATAPVASSAPTIEEMLALMTRQVMEVVQWTHAEGFAESYRTASANSRGLFQSAAIKLAARADTLRKG